MLPVIPKYGGYGAHLKYIGGEGKLSFVRFGHDLNGIVLRAFYGTAVKGKSHWTDASCSSWPHLYVKLDAKTNEIIDSFPSNHIHAIDDLCIDELKLFAKFANIRIYIHN